MSVSSVSCVIPMTRLSNRDVLLYYSVLAVRSVFVADSEGFVPEDRVIIRELRIVVLEGEGDELLSGVIGTNCEWVKGVCVEVVLEDVSKSGFNLSRVFAESFFFPCNDNADFVLVRNKGFDTSAVPDVWCFKVEFKSKGLEEDFVADTT